MHVMSLSNIKDYFLKLMNLSTSVVQFGIPMISVGTVGAMMGAIVASMLDSCADYITYARTMISNASKTRREQRDCHGRNCNQHIR